MRKIYLFCSAGMSTSLLASKMQGVADNHKLPIEIKAFPDGRIGDIINEFHPDVVLLGPQVKHRYCEVKKTYANLNIPIEVINTEDYGLMNGEKILKHAIKLMQLNKKEK